MKTNRAIFLILSVVVGACFGRTTDREIQESLGTSFGYVVKERPAIVARLNSEMDQLADFFFTPEIAAGIRIILEPGDATHNTNGYWIHLHGMRSLWRAIGHEKRKSFVGLIARRYESLAAAAQGGADITRPSEAPLESFLAGEHRANKPSEPTPTAGTPPADARGAPAAVVAHL